MNTELKIVLETILESRAYIYALFHKLLGTNMTKDLLDTMTSDDSIRTIQVIDGEEFSFSKDFCAFLLSYSDADAKKIEKMYDEYTRLFIGPANLIAPPWESVFTSKNHTLFQLSTLLVRAYYQRYAYLPAEYPHTADDHIALMMHFLSLTTNRCLELLAEEKLEELRLVLVDQKKFQTQHLLNWIEEYANQMQESKSFEFYPQCTKYLVRFVQYDHEILDELISYC